MLDIMMVAVFAGAVFYAYLFVKNMDAQLTQTPAQQKDR
jgi:NADH:ubiquinone oxidoreductase subunit 6 (subunit J)